MTDMMPSTLPRPTSLVAPDLLGDPAPGPLQVLVLDVDGAVVTQQRFMDAEVPGVLAFPAYDDQHRYWSTPGDLDALVHRVANARNPKRPLAMFYGSGDAHHLALVGLRALAASGPLARPPLLVVFDNHTDWWGVPRRQHYFGSWVAEAVDRGLVGHVLQFGVDGDLGVTGHMPFPMGRLTHRLDLVFGGRVETYSRTVEHSTLLGQIEGTTPSLTFEHGDGVTRVRWRPFRDRAGLVARLTERLTALPPGPVYVSVDKDVLREDENDAGYAGHQGSMTVDELAAALEVVCRLRPLAGMDVCGDGSRITDFRSLGKQAMHALGTLAHGGAGSDAAGRPAAHDRNAQVNLRLLAAVRAGRSTRTSEAAAPAPRPGGAD